MWQSSWMSLCKLRHTRILVPFRVESSLFFLKCGYLYQKSFVIMEMKWNFFINRVNYYSELKLLVKEQFLVKVKSDSAMYVTCNFCYPNFLVWSIFRSPVDVQLKRLNPLCWLYPWLILFKVKWWQNIGKTMQMWCLVTSQAMRVSSQFMNFLTH